MPRSLRILSLIVLAAALAWFVASHRHAFREKPVPEAPSPASTRPRTSHRAAPSPGLDKSQSRTWKANPNKPDPVPAPLPPSEKALNMEPAEIAGYADQKVGELLVCSGDIDECFDQGLESLQGRGTAPRDTSPEGLKRLKRYFEVKVHNTISYFEFVQRHQERLDREEIDRAEFYERVTRRSYMFEQDSEDLLSESIQEYDAEPFSGEQRLDQRGLMDMLQLGPDHVKGKIRFKNDPRAAETE